MGRLTRSKTDKANSKTAWVECKQEDLPESSKSAKGTLEVKLSQNSKCRKRDCDSSQDSQNSEADNSKARKVGKVTHKATFQEDDNEVEMEIHAHESTSEGELSPSDSEADSEDEVAEIMNQSTVSGNSMAQSEESEVESQIDQAESIQSCCRSKKRSRRSRSCSPYK